MNKKAIEALVKCGAFDSTGASRKGMLATVESAQGAGQKAQLDAQIGQGSIFDLGDMGGGGDATPAPFARPAHPPIPSGEFDRAELLAAEKEAIGIFVSAHPLKEVRPALRAAVDCSLTEVEGHRDGDWVKVGGILMGCKRIRTKNGAPMMFATLDDLEGQVELVVFEKAIAGNEGVLVDDRIVLVRGRVDHKEAGKTCVIVQEAKAFDPSPAEVEAARAKQSAALEVAAIARPLRLRLDAAKLPASIIDDLRHLFETFPGETEVVLEMRTAGGERRLRLGQGYRVAATATLRAELSALLGAALVPAA